MPTFLLILSLPVGAAAYLITAQILQSMQLPEDMRGFLVLFVPLFVAGLVMIPFLIPFFDRKAKADLAELARLRESEGEAGTEPPATSQE
jgi:undecaprenyl pyrophosphate phosphatase UppP